MKSSPWIAFLSVLAIWAVLLAIAFHSNNEKLERENEALRARPPLSDRQLSQYGMIFVKDCSSGRPVALYADQRMTIQMPDPFVSDGSYSFHTTAACVEVTTERRFQ